MPVDSPYPQIEIPSVGIWDHFFERKDKPFADDKVIYTDPYSSRTYTFAQVKQTASDFGKGLRGLWDWQKGDVLALYTPNSIDTPAITWGTLFAGGIVSPANPAYTVEELAFQLKDSGAKAVVTQVPMLQNAVAAAKKVGIPGDRVILLGDQKDEGMRFKHFSSIRNSSGTQRFRRAKTDAAKDLAFLVYSSGTTGHPKGVMLSHTNIVANTMQNVSCETHLGPEDAIISFLPFFHIYGLTCILHHAIYRGFNCVVMPKFDIEGWCKIVQDWKITYGYVVPPVVLLLSKHPCVENYDLSTLRMMNSGAAPLTKELVEALHARKKLKVKQGYGLSETSPTTHIQAWEDWQTHVGSVGKMMPNMTAKFVDPEEKEVSTGEVGELWVKGPNIFQGYLNNPAGTKNALTGDGYFKTGDVGYLDKDQNFYITDRVKELIKYKGFQVPPAELEGLLVSHPKISDVAVIGVYREDMASEVPLAFVVPAASGEVGGDEGSMTGGPGGGAGGMEKGKVLEGEIVGWLNERVAGHKRLRGGVRFVKEIPKSASGKILRRVLKGQLEEEMKRPRAKL